MSYLSGNTEFGQRLTFPSRARGNEERKSSFYVSPDNIIFIEVASVLNGSAVMDLAGQHGSMENATIVSAGNVLFRSTHSCVVLTKA